MDRQKEPEGEEMRESGKIQALEDWTSRRTTGEVVVVFRPLG